MHISPGGQGGILYGSSDKLFLVLVSESNSGIIVVLDSVVDNEDALVVLNFIPGICCRFANVSCWDRDKK
jgi:hypothetical protein